MSEKFSFRTQTQSEHFWLCIFGQTSAENCKEGFIYKNVRLCDSVREDNIEDKMHVEPR